MMRVSHGLLLRWAEQLHILISENAKRREVKNMDQSGGESGDEFSFLPY